ncbi:MAG: flagellar export chaperone FliS [Chloroflexi bacterium]|nr:flagellar export chaperone FliS [Chloroflexota bacterium]
MKLVLPKETQVRGMSRNPYDAYHTVRTTTADPISITTMLFDGCLKAIRKARLFEADGNRKSFLDETDRAQLIVGELLCTLDMEQGEIPKHLSAIYSYCLRCLIEATLGDMPKLDEVEKHIARIADAWKIATAELKAKGAVPSRVAA